MGRYFATPSHISVIAIGGASPDPRRAPEPCDVPFVESELIQGGDPGTMTWVQGLADKLALPATAVSDAIVYAVNQPDHVDVNELVIRSVLDAAA